MHCKSAKSACHLTFLKSKHICPQVLNYQEKLLQSGDADMCYYNFLCSIPVMNVVDFNHIYSNIGYLFFGLLFLVLSAYKVSFKLRQLKAYISNRQWFGIWKFLIQTSNIVWFEIWRRIWTMIKVQIILNFISIFFG